jgi:hypothetical protein
VRIWIRIQGLDEKGCEIFQLKKLSFLSKIAIYLSPVLHEEGLSYRRSLQPSKENIQQFIKIHNFTFLWVFFAHLGPDTDLADKNQCGSIQIRVHITVLFERLAQQKIDSLF